MTKVHVWSNSDCLGIKFHRLSRRFRVSNHVRYHSLSIKHVTQILHALTEPSNKPAVHLLIFTNKDIHSLNILPKALGLILQTSLLKENLILVAVDLLKGKSDEIENTKNEMKEVAGFFLKDLGRSLRSSDFMTRSRLTIPASRKVEEKINSLIQAVTT